VLLAPDDVTLYPPGTEPDGHGWAQPSTEPFWTGRGSLQLQPGISDPLASGSGGAGPFDPARTDEGALYLPPGVEVRDGCRALVRGRMFVLSNTRLVRDPTGTGMADCYAAAVSATDTWPGAGGS